MTRSAIFALACCLCLQEVVHLVQYSWMQAPFYPSGFDQVDYLLVLARTLAPDSPDGLLDLGIAQGWLLHILAWPLARLGLPPAWAVHIPLLVLEAGLFLVARRRGAAAAWLALGLVFSARAHEALYGGPADYRHDYLSLVLFGATALAAYAAAPFRRLGPVVVVGILGGLAVHARFLTSAYLVAAVPWLVGAALASSAGGRAGRLAALGNLGVGLLVGVLIALPFYLLNRDAIHGYYFQGHVLSAVEAEARGFAGARFVDFFSDYWRNLLRHQLGPSFLALGLLAMAGGLLARARGNSRLPWPRLLVVAGFMMPLPVLSLGLQRSQVVALVMVVPVCLGVLALAEPMLRERLGRRALVVLGLAGVLTFPFQVLGEGQQVWQSRLQGQHDRALAGLQTLGRRLPDDRTVTLSVLGLHEALSASMVRLMRWRERGLWGGEVIGNLGHTIYRLGEEELREKLLASDLVLVPEGIPLPSNPLPSQVQLHEKRAELIGLLGGGWRRERSLDFALDGGWVRAWLRLGFSLRPPTRPATGR